MKSSLISQPPHSSDGNGRPARKKKLYYSGLTVLLLLVFFHAVVNYGLGFFSPELHSLYRFDGISWQKEEFPGGFISKLATDSEGRLLALAYNEDSRVELYQHNGGWELLELPFSAGWDFSSNFDLSLKGLWASGEGRLYIRNGSEWQEYPLPEDNARPLHVSSSSYSVWLISESGKLWHYQQPLGWSEQALPEPTTDLQNSPVTLYTDKHEVTWLQLSDKLYRFLNQEWQLLDAGPIDAQPFWFLGEAADSLWLAGAGALLQVAYDGTAGPVTTLSPTSSGEYQTIQTVFIASDFLLVAHGQELYRLSANGVTLEETLPIIGEQHLHPQFARTADGRYWAYSFEFGTASSGWYAVGYLLGLFLLLWVWEKSTHTYFRSRDEEQIQEALSYRTPAAEPTTAANLSTKPSLASRMLVWSLGALLFLAVALSYIFIGGHLQRLTGGLLPGGLLWIVYLVTSLTVVITLVNTIAVKWAIAPHLEGRHQASLKRIISLRALLGAVGQPLECLMLLKVGRYDEAEALSSHYLQQKQNSGTEHKILLLGVLGMVNTEKRRFSEAEEAFKRALELKHDDYILISGLAECYLEQGGRNDTALALIQGYLSDKSIRTASTPPALDLRAKLAQVLAAIGRIDEATAEIEAVLTKCDGRKQHLAMFSLAAGEVYRAARNPRKSKEFYTTAYENDPEGDIGRRAKAKLAARPDS